VTRLAQQEEYPFIFLFSQVVPHSKGAGSILLLRLLQHWPADRLIVIGPSPPHGAKILDCAYLDFKPLLTRIQTTRFAPLGPPLSAIFSTRIPQLDVKRPALVLSVMQTTLYYRAAYRAARRLKLPFCLIVHDDPEEFEPVSWWNRPIVRGFNQKAYSAAEARFCISPQLREVLARRYGAVGEVLYPNRSADLVPRDPDLSRALRQTRLTIGYAGTMTYGYGDRLEELLPFFRASGATLRIYSMQEPRFSLVSGVQYAGPYQQPDEVWTRVKEECDVVILPYCGPEHGCQNLYKTHFPSKLPEYLALGMPVIVTGPAYATGMEWASAHPDACIKIGLDETEQWPAVLSRLTKDAEYRRTLGAQALNASKQFDPCRIVSEFENRLRAIGEKWQVADKN